MRLRKFRVRAFRCIHDSGEIKVGDLAAFVGRNESGKTTILQGLTLLNKDENVSNLDLCDEMSEELKNEINIADGDFDKMLVGTTEHTALENFIGEYLHPRFVYFSDYKKIYGNINLNEYVKESKGYRTEGIEFVEEFDKAETVRNLFYLAELDIEGLEEFHNSPSKLIKYLNTASNRLTTRLNPAWKGDPIHVDLRYNPGNILSVVISDVHKDGTVTNTGLLNRRAEGFKWTFSFIVNFAAETQRAELKEAILLLDEPARNLHPTQQRGISDLLKNLAGSNQVLYATHSPFMIFDYTPGNLLVVELDKRKHLSKIYYDYWNASDETLTPILYGLSRGLVESIVDREIGSNSRPVIIVETMSDAMYLNAFDKFLEDPNISMNPLNVVAAYSKNSVLPLAIFYRDHGYKTFILLDNSEESKHISTQLTANDFSQVQTIFFESGGKQIQSIEDYLHIEDFLYAVNQTYGIMLRREGFSNLAKEDVLARGKKGIVENLNAIWMEHKDEGWGKFNNEEITRYICEKIALNEIDFLSDKSKEQLRTLYRLIAERIRQHQNLISSGNLDKLHIKRKFDQ